jgi:xylulokinase
MTLYLGIDVGTFESKGVLVDRSGAVVASAARPHRMLVPQPGWAEHRPEEDWWGDFAAIARELTAAPGVDPREIRAVAASAIGPCMLPVDAAGRALMNGVLYNVDSRSVEEIAELTAEIGEDRLHARCGNGLTAQSVGPKILWLKRNRPEIHAAADRIVTSTTFIVRRLTGRTVMDHYTAATWTPLYDIEARAWAPDLCAGIVDPARLPDLAWSGEIAGTVTAEAAAETGLVPGTPVTTGTIDAASEALSVGVLEAGDMMLMYGSSIFIIEVTDRRVADRRIWYAPWLFPHQHAAMAGLGTSGTLTHWFRDQLARDLDPATAMPALAAEAASSPPGANGLVFLPYFTGAGTPLYEPRARGAYFGLDLTHTRADMIRALFEGVGQATRLIMDAYAEGGAEPARLVAVGGGTRNGPWMQAMSDILGRPQTIRRVSAGAAYGDAFLAALAVGDVVPETIRDWNPTDREVVPDPATADVHRRAGRRFRGLYEATLPLLE